MRWKTKIKTQSPLIFAFSLISAALFLILYFHPIINITSSMPKGLYDDAHQKLPTHHDIVALCLPENLRHVAQERGYLVGGIYCHGTSPLIKEVIAVPGDKVVMTDKSLVVNHKAYLISKYTRDSSGQALTAFPNGSYIAQGFWVLGSYDHRSWDSRYFGELPPSAIFCTLKPLITW